MINVPSHNYFRPKEGHWRGEFRLSITHWGLFWATPMAWLDRLCMASAASLPKLIGALWIETSVDYASRAAEGEVIHTTKICKWGMTFFRSLEILSLHENGRDFTVRGEQRFWPKLWSPRDYQDSSGSVDEIATRATYSLSWLGGRLQQRTEPEDGGLRVYQTTDWSSATFLLRHLR